MIGQPQPPARLSGGLPENPLRFRDFSQRLWESRPSRPRIRHSLESASPLAGIAVCVPAHWSHGGDGLGREGRCPPLREVRRLKVDVVLLDLYYGGHDAFGQLAALTKSAPNVRTIVVSGDNHPDTITRAFEAGARGYVVKGDSREIIAAIQAVSAGKTWRPGDFSAARQASGQLDDTIDAMIAALGDPAAVEGRTWVWQVGRLRIEALAEGTKLLIDLPWPLRTIDEPPSFGDLHEEAGGQIKLRFAIAARAALDLVLGVINYETRVV